MLTPEQFQELEKRVIARLEKSSSNKESRSEFENTIRLLLTRACIITIQEYEKINNENC